MEKIHGRHQLAGGLSQYSQGFVQAVHGFPEPLLTPLLVQNQENGGGGGWWGNKTGGPVFLDLSIFFAGTQPKGTKTGLGVGENQGPQQSTRGPHAKRPQAQDAAFAGELRMTSCFLAACDISWVRKDARPSNGKLGPTASIWGGPWGS